MQSTPILRYSNRKLLEWAGAEKFSLEMGVKFVSNLTILAGTVLAQLSSTAVNNVQRLTPTGTYATGSAYPTHMGVVSTIAITPASTAAEWQTSLYTIAHLKGNVTVSGGPLASGFLAFTFSGDLAGLPQEILSLSSDTLAGGSGLAWTQHVVGVSFDRWMTADISTIADPTTGPAVTAETGGTMPVGTYLAQMAWYNANGETLPSRPVAVIVPDSTNDRLTFAAISAGNTPDEATGIRYYVNGVLVADVAVGSGAIAATNVDAMPTTGTVTVPKSVNTAYKYTDGRQIPKGLAKYDMKTLADGSVIKGTATQAQWGGPGDQTSPVFLAGIFVLSELPGMTAALLAALGGRLVKGSFTDPTTALVKIPA